MTTIRIFGRYGPHRPKRFLSRTRARRYLKRNGFRWLGHDAGCWVLNIPGPGIWAMIV